MADYGRDLEIPIWIGGCQKWVNGLTKRTTCDDVIHALLRHDRNSNAFVDVSSYVIYERWRDVERPLRGRTKLLKVWRAWGADCRNVKFFLRKSESSLDSSSEMSPHKHHRSKGKRHQGHYPSKHSAECALHESNIPHGHYQRRADRVRQKQYTTYYGVVGHRPVSGSRGRTSTSSRGESGRKSSKNPGARGKTSSNRTRTKQGLPTSDKTKSEAVAKAGLDPSNPANAAVQRLLHTILDQEKRIQQQMARLGETDTNIESLETERHLERVKENGKDYVQQAYMRDTLDSVPDPGDPEKIQEYVKACEGLLELQERLSQEEHKINDLSAIVSEESRLVSSGNNPDAGSGSSRLEESRIQAEFDQLKGDLARSIALSKAQQRQLRLVNETLDSCEVDIQRKILHENQLLLELDQLENPRHGDVITDSHKTADSGKSHQHTMRKTVPSVQDIHIVPNVPALTAKSLHSANESISNLQASDASSPTQNSDSGVESLSKTDTENRHSRQYLDPGFHSMDPLHRVPVSGRNMVPYLTYASYEESRRQKRKTALQTELPSMPRMESVVPVPAIQKDSGEDSNSDTGLSSLHSDEQPPVLETLV